MKVVLCMYSVPYTKEIKAEGSGGGRQLPKRRSLPEGKKKDKKGAARGGKNEGRCRGGQQEREKEKKCYSPAAAAEFAEDDLAET